MNIFGVPEYCFYVIIIVTATVVGLIVGVPLGIAMFVWGLIDAYQGARRWNARHGIIS